MQAIRAYVADPSGETALVSGIAAAPFLLSGGLALGWGLSRLPNLAALHQGGVFYRDRKGEHAIPWGMIDGVYQKIVRVYQAGTEVDVRDVYTISLRDGRALVVDYHFADIADFGTAIIGTVTSVLLPACQQAFRAGQTLDFGAVAINARGISADGKVLPWGEVESLSWRQGILASDRGFLQIRRAGGLLAWAKVPIERIKNYQVLMTIASEMARVE